MYNAATHVLKTMHASVEILAYNNRNQLVGRFSYRSRARAIKALEQMRGEKVVLRPMVTEGAEKAVPTHIELSDETRADE